MYVDLLASFVRRFNREERIRIRKYPAVVYKENARAFVKLYVGGIAWTFGSVVFRKFVMK